MEGQAGFCLSFSRGERLRHRQRSKRARSSLAEDLWMSHTSTQKGMDQRAGMGWPPHSSKLILNSPQTSFRQLQCQRKSCTLFFQSILGALKVGPDKTDESRNMPPHKEKDSPPSLDLSTWRVYKWWQITRTEEESSIYCLLCFPLIASVLTLAGQWS